MNTISHLTEETFTETVEQPGLIGIHLWAGWFGPCRAMAPQFETAARLGPENRFAKVDVDAEPGLAGRFGSARSRPSCCCATASRSRPRPG